MRSTILLQVAALVIGIAGSAVAEQAPKGPVERPVAEVKASDFAWMTGRWRGDLTNGMVAEQICSRPDKGEMLCLFRINNGKQYVMFELYTLLETPDGPELRSVHFDPSLAKPEKQEPLVLKLAKYSESEVVFDGAAGSQVKHSSLFRKGADEMQGVIEFVGREQPHVQVRWTRQPY